MRVFIDTFGPYIWFVVTLIWLIMGSWDLIERVKNKKKGA
jgi:hypothetical protein